MELHPAHVAFAKKICLIRLNEFFAVIDAIDPNLRDSVLFDTYMNIVGMETDPHPDPKAPMSEAVLNCINYPTFKAECWKLTSHLPDFFLVQSIIHSALSQAFHLADDAGVPKLLEFLRGSSV